MRTGADPWFDSALLLTLPNPFVIPRRFIPRDDSRGGNYPTIWPSRSLKMPMITEANMTVQMPTSLSTKPIGLPLSAWLT